MKTLLIDDDDSLLGALQNMLEPMGHDVDSANTAEKAVELVGENTYDFVFVDYKMPVHNGIWFMKNAKIAPSSTVLLMTAYLDRRVIDEMFSLGASGYLIKPFDSGELEKHLQYHLNKPEPK